MTDPTLCDYYATWESDECDPDPEVCVNCQEGESAQECASRFAVAVKEKRAECPPSEGGMMTMRANRDWFGRLAFLLANRDTA